MKKSKKELAKKPIKRPKDARAIDQQVDSIKRTKANPKPTQTHRAKIRFKLNMKQAPKPPKLPMIHHKHIKQIKISLSNMHNKARARLKLAEHEVEDAVNTLHDAIKKFKSVKF